MFSQELNISQREIILMLMESVIVISLEWTGIDITARTD